MADTSGPWDQYRTQQPIATGDDDGPWRAYSTLGGEKPKSRNLAAVANDTAIEVANAAAGGVSAAANFIKPGNAVSGWIDKSIIKAGEDSQSDVTKAAKQQFRQGVGNADGVMDELGAVGRYVVENPLLSAAQAAGSFVGPGATVKALGFAGKAARLGAKGVELAGRAGGVAAGAAMAGGDAAGTAYELATKAGATEDQAVAAGRQASVIPAVIGGVGGMFGAEKLLAGAKGFAGGTASRALKTGASEAFQEGVEEGATQYEGQRAAMPFDPSIDPAKGVAAAAGMGAALGGITGAGVSVLTGRDTGLEPSQEPPAAPPAAPQPQAGPTLALPAPDPGVIAVDSDGTARTPAYQKPSFAGEYADVTDVGSRELASQPADPVRAAVESAANAGGALSAAAGVALDLGATNAQFLGATGRDVQLSQTGPGVTDESNVIDVDAREVPDQRGIPTARRLTNEQGGALATASQTLALPAPTNLREGLERIRAQKQEAARLAQVPPTQGANLVPQAPEAQQAISQQPQAGGQAIAGPAAAPTAGQSAAPGGSGVQAAGVGDGTTTENPGAQAAAGASAPEFTTIKTVNGDSVTVRTADLQGDSPRLRQYTKAGKSKAVPAIHRDNLDLTGEKSAASAKENADNPMFNTVTNRDGGAFGSVAVAQREVNRLGLSATHDVVPTGNGFVGLAKTETVQAQQSAINKVPAPTQQAPEAIKNVAEPKTGTADAANKAVDSDVAESTTAAPASAEQRMPVQAIEPKKPATNKPRGVLAKKAEAEAKARADYFTPGNVVQGYSGHDRVIAYNPPGEDGQWSVTVRAVEKQGDAWMDKAGERERVHGTQPDAKALKAGPVVRGGSIDAQDATKTITEPGEQDEGTASAGGAGQRPGGGADKLGAAVRTGVPAAGGASEQASGVAAPKGREVSRDVGKYKEGMSEYRANQVRSELARKTPGVIYTVEEDASLKNGYAVVGRATAPGKKVDAEKVRTTEERAPAMLSQAQPQMSQELAQSILALRRPPETATKDSVRAAVRELVNGLGLLPNRLGRVVVATSDEIKNEWEPLIGATTMDSEGAGQAQGFYDPASKTVFLIADNIKAGDELGVVAHELMHKHGPAVLGQEGWDKLHSAIGGWASAPKESMERTVYAEAARRVRKSRPADADVQGYSSQELFPYAVQVALEMGVRPNALAPQGTVARWLAQVRSALRTVWNKIASSKGDFNSLDLVNLAFGIAQRENPAHSGELDAAAVDGAARAQKALKEISDAEDLFALPKSEQSTVDGITAAHDPEIKVTTTDLGGETMYTLTMPDGTRATITSREPTKDEVFGMDESSGRWITERPGEKAPPVGSRSDVWVDVSALKPGQNGARVYNIAATYAHNTGRIFIGDPSGLSDVALRRRAEQMLSSALKFGTTDHLAPHPRQVAGDAALGVPPLRWVYGDHAGNIDRLVDVNQKALENVFSDAKNLSYDLDTGNFIDDRTGTVLTREALARSADARGRSRGESEAGAGWKTTARSAVFRALLREERSGSEGGGQGGRFLGGLVSQRAKLASATERADERIFYSRTAGAGSVSEGGASRTQGQTQMGNAGDFDPDTADIRFSRASSAAAAGDAWDAPVQTGFDDVIYKLQDKNIDLKRVLEAITKSVGKVADSINAYLKEELFHKRAAKRVADFGARELKPLMNQMRLAGLSMEDVEEYLHARHAKEANAVIAQRNPGNAGLQDGGSGMTNQAADNYFAKIDPAQRKKLEAVAKNVDAIIADTRKLYVSYGLEDQAVVDGWSSMYQHYIPLMREDKEGGMGTGQGFSVKGKETKGRTGSTRKVVDVLANIASQREKLIVRGEKNRVTQALVGLAQANPNPEFWEVRSQAPTERVFDPKTGVVVDRPDPLFKSRDNVIVAKVKDAKGNVTEQMVVFNEDNPRAVRMAAAMKNLDAGNLEGLLGISAKITRYFSAINTQYNPVFGVVNLVRDVQGAMVNLAATPLAGQQGKIAKDTVSALAGIYSDIRKTRKGGQATSKWAQLWEQMQDDGGTTGYRELFTTSADRANNLKSILNPEGWMDNKWGKFFTAGGKLKVPMSVAQKGASEIFGWLSDYNEAMENGVRLAAYKAALDKGMSREQAASLAKNLTVNFNRKGQVGQQAGAVYAFFNAAMQGTARIGQTLFDIDGGDISTLRLSKTGKAVVYGGVTLGALQALALAGAGFDDEDPPEFVRERSLIIPTGGKTYVAIPMPLGLHVIPGIGRHAAEFALSGFDKPAKRAVSMVGMFADAFNPIGNAGLSMQTIAPTAIDPLAALTENKDWTGKPIARVSSNRALPGHTQWKDTATGVSKVVAEAINWVSGGNEYVAGAFSPTPDQIDYLLAQVGGGVAREAAKVQQTITTAFSGEALPTHKVPLLGRFVGNAASQASQGGAFYANLNKLNELETEIKGLRKDGRFDEAAKLVRENPQATMIAMANRAERDVQKLRRDKRELIAKDASREEVRAKEEQITAVMMRLNEAAERRKAN